LKKEKVIRDPIFGYISIPHNYFDDFIDNEIFQRLRRIEQTSMRVVYPSAHHDRFSHSIGVFHLGRIAFKHIRENSSKHYEKIITNDVWNKYQNSFEIACLLHDCGHAPFSHTLENYFLDSDKKKDFVEQKLIHAFQDEPSFFNELKSAAPNPHEKISTVIILEKFADIIIGDNYKADVKLVCRMILGCTHSGIVSKVKQVENKLIRLLNGKAFDVDGLDYIQRDTWASGVSNMNIDYERLLASLEIKDNKDGVPQIIFKKQAQSVINNISIGRNFLFQWIYAHHKAVYEMFLIQESIDIINKNHLKTLSDKLLSVDAILNKTSISKEFEFYLPTDDDIIHVFKRFMFKNIEPINEFLSRKHRYKALWKSTFEFYSLFGHISNDNLLNIYETLRRDNPFDFKIITLKAILKLKPFNKGEIYIDLNGTIVDAANLSFDSRIENIFCFYCYVEKDKLDKKEEIISKLKTMVT